MSVLLRGSIRPNEAAKRRRTRPSVREICLLGTAGSALTPGDRVSQSGRTYRVEVSQVPCAGAVGYLHLSCVDRDGVSGRPTTP